MDILKIRNTINNNKQIVNKIAEPIKKTYIIYLLNNTDIIYIGTSQNLTEYIEERVVKYKATHYTVEEINENEASNYLAELLLELQPIFNKRIPKNTKFISNTKAKEDYFLNKLDFRKEYNINGGWKFGNSLYMLRTIFDDIFCFNNVYHKDMPRLGKSINLIEDIKGIDLNYSGGMQYGIAYDENHNEIEVLREYSQDWNKLYNNMNMAISLEYQVIEHINENTFIAKNKSNQRFELKSSDKNNTWVDGLTEFDCEMINYNYDKNNE